MTDLDQLEVRIQRWHEHVFGPMTPELRLRVEEKFAEESKEFLDSNCRDPKEAADVLIVLLRFAAHHGWNLTKDANDKLDVLEHPDRNQMARDAERGII